MVIKYELQYNICYEPCKMKQIDDRLLSLEYDNLGVILESCFSVYPEKNTDSLHIRFDCENGIRVDLPARQLRAATHDLDIACVTEQSIALLSSQLLDDAELLQVAEWLVNRRWGDAGLCHQRARGGDGLFHKCPVDPEA